MRAVVAGVFVGGKGARLGGAAKGMLPAPGGGTLVERWVALLGDLGIPVVLVGRDRDDPDYAGIALERVRDEPPGIGPLGGLVGLLQRAGEGSALALACDMPFVSRRLVEELLTVVPGAPIVAPRRSGIWEPLCALYDAPRVLPIATARAARGAHSLQGLLDESQAIELPLDANRHVELHDWDTPADLVS